MNDKSEYDIQAATVIRLFDAVRHLCIALIFATARRGDLATRHAIAGLAMALEAISSLQYGRATAPLRDVAVSMGCRPVGERDGEYWTPAARAALTALGSLDDMGGDHHPASTDCALAQFARLNGLSDAVDLTEAVGLAHFRYAGGDSAMRVANAGYNGALFEAVRRLATAVTRHDPDIDAEGKVRR